MGGGFGGSFWQDGRDLKIVETEKNRKIWQNKLKKCKKCSKKVEICRIFVK
jgi:hypothetical protein